MKQLSSALLFIFFGMLFFAHQQSWIIISLPDFFQKMTPRAAMTTASAVQEVQLIRWDFKKNQYKTSTAEIISCADKAHELQLLLNHWLLLLEDENIITQQIFVQSVALTDRQNEAFISISKSPFDPAASTYHKLKIMQGLLATIKQHDAAITKVRLLVHHQPLVDDHLNFAISWPVIY